MNKLGESFPEESDVEATATDFGATSKTIFRWRKGIFQRYGSYFASLVIFITSFYLVYGLALSADQEQQVREWTQFFSKYGASLPQTLILGFFTSYSLQRFANLYANMPGTSKILTIFVSTLKSDFIKRNECVATYRRWVLLVWAMTFRTVSKSFRKHYPTLESFQNEGLITEHEMAMLLNYPKDERPLIVFDWMNQMLFWISSQKGFSLPADYNRNIDAVMSFRKTGSNLLKACRKNISPMLVQIVGMSTCTSVLCSLVTISSEPQQDKVITIIRGVVGTVLQLMASSLFFIWWKIGLIAANPFGKDEEDVNVCRLFDCHKRTTERIMANFRNPEEYFFTFSAVKTNSE